MYNNSTESMETVSKYVTDRLRKEIINGRFASGERIRIKQIAEEYKVSQMPVREAFNRLKGENIIEIEQYKGAVIRPMNSKSIADVYDVRCSIETLIMKNIAARGLTDDEAEHLHLINRSIDYSLPPEQLSRQFSEMNDRFHAQLLALCDNQHAVEVYVSFSRLLSVLKARFPVSPERVKASQQEHEKLIECLKLQDVEGIALVTEQHAKNAKAHMLPKLHERKKDVANSKST